MSESVKIDLRLDPGLKEKLEVIAVERFEAKIHHRSHRPELTTTINRLIKLGIKALEDGYQDKSVNYPDNAVSPETMNQAIAAALSPISEELELLKKLVSGILTTPPPLPAETEKPVETVEMVEPVESLETEKPVEAIAPAPTPNALTPGEALTVNQLAQRFNCDVSSIYRAWKADRATEPRPEHFREWSKAKDPDNYGWTKDGDKFFPVSD